MKQPNTILQALRKGKTSLRWALLILIVSATPIFAQSGSAYDLSWWTIGSGGVSSGGNYILNSAIGQPEAGVQMKDSSSRYTLVGGFMDIAANPTIAPPPGDEKVYLPVILNN